MLALYSILGDFLAFPVWACRDSGADGRNGSLAERHLHAARPLRLAPMRDSDLPTGAIHRRTPAAGWSADAWRSDAADRPGGYIAEHEVPPRARCFHTPPAPSRGGIRVCGRHHPQPGGVAVPPQARVGSRVRRDAARQPGRGPIPRRPASGVAPAPALPLLGDGYRAPISATAHLKTSHRCLGANRISATDGDGGMNGGKRHNRGHPRTRGCPRLWRYCWGFRGADRGTRTRDLLFTSWERTFPRASTPLHFSRQGKENAARFLHGLPGASSGLATLVGTYACTGRLLHRLDFLQFGRQSARV